MKMWVIYSAKSDQEKLRPGHKQNHFIICDPETGAVYKSTDLKLAASGIEPSEDTVASLGAKSSDDLNVIGRVDSGKIIYFEDRSGLPESIVMQMMNTHLTPAERNRVLAAKAAFDSKELTPQTNVKCAAELNNG